MSFDERNANQIFEHEISPQACRELWCAVIDGQLRMAVKPTSADRPHEVRAARTWFGSKDFYTVCALAGLDGSWVLSGVQRRFSLGAV